MVSKQTIRNVFRVFFPLLFVCYWGGMALFSHSHVVNGVIVAHSHPFKEGHTHGASGMETIFFLTHFSVSGQEAVASPLIFGLCLLGVFLIPAVRVGADLHASQVVVLRAPPFRL